jgi:hypothetical protein
MGYEEKNIIYITNHLLPFDVQDAAEITPTF